MEKPNIKLLNSILAAGILFIFIGFLLILGYAGSNVRFVTWIIPALLFLAGLIDLYTYMVFSKSSFKLFLGLALTCYGILALIINCFQIFDWLPKIWPFFILVTGISLFAAGRTKGRRFAVAYDLPGISLLVLGGLFLLFSFGIIQVSMRALAVFAFPGILILAGVFLVVLFFQRKKLLEILPDDLSKELNSDENFDDNEEE